MDIWYTARTIFDKTNVEAWQTYISWSGLTQLQELVGLDCMLCDPVFEPDFDHAETWDLAKATPNEYFTNCYSSLEYVKLMTAGKSEFNLLAVCFDPIEACENYEIKDFDFIGYELLDYSNDTSALTNCGGFNEVFSNGEINVFGLLNSYERAIQIREDLLKTYPEEYHADTNIWAIWRYNQRSGFMPSRQEPTEVKLTKDQVMEGTFMVKKSVNGRGCYASVTVNVTETKTSGYQIEYLSQSEYDAQWKNAVAFAVEYFYEKYQSKNKNGIHVIVDVRYMIVDTTAMIVFYTTIQALCLALNFEIPGLNLDLETGLFCFPR